MYTCLCSCTSCSDTTWDEDASADAGVEENDADMDDAKLEGFKVRHQLIVLKLTSNMLLCRLVSSFCGSTAHFHALSSACNACGIWCCLYCSRAVTVITRSSNEYL
jgi:hypothetical protein